MSASVLDASAILAFLENEPGASAVAPYLPGAAVSAVNLAEVISKLSDRGLDERHCRGVIEDLGIRVIPFDESAAFKVAALRGSTRLAGLSLGDRACLALGKLLDLPVVTADRSWMRLDIGAEIRLIR